MKVYIEMQGKESSWFSGGKNLNASFVENIISAQRAR